MKLTMIALFSTYMGCYDQPTFHNILKEDVAEQYRRSVLANPEQAYAAKAQDKVVCYLGTFDDKTGEIDKLDVPEKLLDLAGTFPPGFLAKKEQANA